jgi:pimeloyl-ACP methyl ester carboxylesterase
VHFLHVRSPEPQAFPLVLTHGWPGSIVEFLDTLGPLTRPHRPGGRPAPAFHLVVPSIPGFGLSGPTTDAGWDVARVARAWVTLADSPVGQLAWIVEKFHDWVEAPETIDRDRLLTNVMLYWLSTTAGSSARLYHETFHTPMAGTARPLTVPTGVAVFAGDVAAPVRRLAEHDNAIVHWSEVDRGGHFAALEQPDLFVADVRAFFAALAPDGGGQPHL